jgi:subtilisin family serine protease
MIPVIAGHGTAVAAIIAAKTNNNIGIAGINPQAKILPIRVGDLKGAYDSDAIAGIYYAIKNNAKVINISIRGSQFSELYFEAVFEAYKKGIVVVASSGNEGKQKKPVTYPAAYPTVISVGSTNPKDQRSNFSNYGLKLDLAAPGEKIITAGLNSKYIEAAGTSFSAPIVSGVATSFYPKHQISIRLQWNTFLKREPGN